jgi:hypothetical protein
MLRVMSPTKDIGLSLYIRAKAVGSNPAPATNFNRVQNPELQLMLRVMSPTKDIGLSLYTRAKVAASNPALTTLFP